MRGTIKIWGRARGPFICACVTEEVVLTGQNGLLLVVPHEKTSSSATHIQMEKEDQQTLPEKVQQRTTDV